uniref:SpoIIE family protein phosphatase n=1 Tax=Streptomyces himalayensis TaxID=2820085 RepID=UPI0028B17AA3|nr:SpoIIE family protein phosphatase [Streptomyces himalayensis]
MKQLLDLSLPAADDHGGQAESHVALSVRHRDGRVITLPVSCYPLPSGQTVSGWVLVFGPPPDVTGRREREALSDWVLDRSPTALTVYDTDLHRVCESAEMRRLTGVPGGGHGGLALTEIVRGSDRIEWEQRMRLALETGEEQAAFDVCVEPTEVTRSHMYRVSATPLRNGQGQTIGVCASVTDVSEARRARERLALVNEASAHIGSTLDLTLTGQELTEVVVPRLSDFARVDLLEVLIRGEEPAPGPLPGAVRLRRIAERVLLGGSLQSLTTASDADVYTANSPTALCLARGESAIYRTDDPVIRSWMAEDTGRRARIAGRRVHSWILAPLKARGTTLGVVMLARQRETPEPFEREDLALVEELVSRAALSLDNARRFTRERTAALALQRSLLPQRLPRPSAVEAASRYLPASPSTGVGGDWFDVIELSGARVGLVVGDVVGHGIHAAAAMGRLRTAVRTLADVDPSPDELLTRLDDLILRFAEEAESAGSEGPAGEVMEREAADIGATCLYAVYDPVSGRCSMARAGHPPPVCVAPNGKRSFLELPAGPPLGLGGLPFESAEVTLPEGSLLALYTDGLVESQHDVDVGLETLRGVLTPPGDSLETLCDRAVGALVAGRRVDDAALLLVRLHMLDAEQVAVWDVAPNPAEVARLRAESVRKLTQWGHEEAAFVTELVVSELVTNAIRYGSPPIQLRLINDRRLICEVSDGSSTAPHMRRARVFDENGRGLLLIAQLTDRWGTRQTTTGKTIWCEQFPPNTDERPSPQEGITRCP